MDLWKIIPRGALVEYHTDINFTPAANSVLIIDESDEHIYGDPLRFSKFVKKAQCICLTATCAEDSERGIERQVLKNMEF